MTGEEFGAASTPGEPSPSVEAHELWRISRSDALALVDAQLGSPADWTSSALLKYRLAADFQSNWKAEVVLLHCLGPASDAALRTAAQRDLPRTFVRRQWCPIVNYVNPCGLETKGSNACSGVLSFAAASLSPGWGASTGFSSGCKRRALLALPLRKVRGPIPARSARWAMRGISANEDAVFTRWSRAPAFMASTALVSSPWLVMTSTGQGDSPGSAGNSARPHCQTPPAHCWA